MKTLLEQNFISHHGLAVNVTVGIVYTTDADFGLIDKDAVIVTSEEGIAKYSNPSLKRANVINYESFFKALPQSFQDNKNNCDLILYTSDNQYFLLNELTDTRKGKGRKRKHAIKQMLQVLKDILAVPEIELFIGNCSIKQCCYFNKKVQAPSRTISATTTFGRLNNIAPHGFQMSCPDVESLGFDLWEFSGNQTYLLQDKHL